MPVAGRRASRGRGRGETVRSWVLTGIQGGHEQREPGQLILHRCFHVPDRSRRRVLLCAARVEFVAETREEGPSFGTFGAGNTREREFARRVSERWKVESDRAEQSKWYRARARLCDFVRFKFYSLGSLSLAIRSGRRSRQTYHATDRALLTAAAAAERTRAEFRRRQRACVDRSRHRSRESVRRPLLAASRRASRSRGPLPYRAVSLFRARARISRRSAIFSRHRHAPPSRPLAPTSLRRSFNWREILLIELL